MPGKYRQKYNTIEIKHPPATNAFIWYACPSEAKGKDFPRQTKKAEVYLH